MKKNLILLVAVLSALFFSCEKENTDIFNEISFALDQKILDGYFVTAIDFDSEGTAWIGTFNQGLIRYANGNITIYDQKNSPLDSSYIHDIAIDSKDNVWIGSNGLIKYDGRTFKKYDSANSVIPENHVSSIAIDSYDCVWFTSCRFKQGGLIKFDGSRWQMFTPQNSGLPCNLINDIAIDKNNVKYVALGEKVNEVSMVKISGDTWKIITDQEFGFNPYYWGKLTVDNENNVIATINYGLSSTYDISRPNLAFCNNGNWKVNNPVDIGNNSLGYVSSVCCDNNGFVWAGLYGNHDYKKLAVYNGKQWFVNNDFLDIQDIFVMKADKSNRIWLGTGTGIQIIQSSAN